MYRKQVCLVGMSALVLIGACAPQQEAVEVAQPTAEPIPLTPTSEEVEQLLEEGHYLADVGRVVEAREKFAAAASADPDSVQAHVYQAANALSFQEFQQALDAAAAVEGGNEGEQKLVAIYQTFLTNDTEQGITLAEELVAMVPNSPRALTILAGLQAGNNDAEAARASYRKALELDPEYPAALFGMAGNYLFVEPRDFEMAEQWADKAVAAYPDEAKAYELLGDVKRGQNDLEAALDAYNQASEVDPALAAAHHKRGHINSFLGNIEDARAAYDQGVEAAEVENKANFAVFKAFTRVHEGDMEAAIDELVALAEQVPEMGTPEDQIKGSQTFALNSAAQVALHAGMLDRAAELIEERNEIAMAIAEDVGTEDAERLQKAGCHQWDGLLAAYRGDAEAAAAEAAEIETLLADDDNPRKMEGAHFALGVAALENEDYAAAVEHLRQADHRNNIYVRYLLARAEEGTGNTEEAARLYDDVATFNFNSVGFAMVHEAAQEKAEELGGEAA